KGWTSGGPNPLLRYSQDRTVLDFGRDDTLLFANQPAQLDAAEASQTTTWQALTGDQLSRTNIAGRVIGGSQAGASAGLFALCGRELVWQGRANTERFILPDWLEGTLFARVSPSGNIVAVVDSCGRHIVHRLADPGSFVVLLEGRTSFE